MSIPAPRSVRGLTATPQRPPMDPPHGVRQIPLVPHQMVAAVTPHADVFTLAHLGIPRVDPAGWSLVVDGLVGRVGTLSLDQLKARPRTVVEAVHQCCGNPMEPRVPARRVANVRWGGVDLAALLAEFEVDPRAASLWSYGLDGGDIAGRHCDWYVKDMPLARLGAGGVLLADEMDGVPLSSAHGFPLRLVIPGYYGTNSVKWLWRLHLAAGPFDGPFTTDLYNDNVMANGGAVGLAQRQPVWAIAPESIIVAPAPDAVVRRGERIDIWGWAWSFRGITAVEVSVDGGTSFAPATLAPRCGWTWQRFTMPWLPTATGDVQLCARAVDADGAAQPRDAARNAVHSVRVVVR